MTKPWRKTNSEVHDLISLVHGKMVQISDPIEMLSANHIACSIVSLVWWLTASRLFSQHVLTSSRFISFSRDDDFYTKMRTKHINKNKTRHKFDQFIWSKRPERSFKNWDRGGFIIIVIIIIIIIIITITASITHYYSY